MKKEKIIKLPCGYSIFESNKMKKFSVIYTMITLSLDRKQWEKDLYGLYLDGWDKNTKGWSFFPTRYNGKICLYFTSLESLFDIANFFENKKFRITIGECIGRLKREWIERGEKKLPYADDVKENFFQLFLHIKCKNDYFKFRELLLSKELKDMGYLSFHSFGGEDQGIYGDITKIIDVLV